MNELAPGTIHAKYNRQTELWRFRVVGCAHSLLTMNGTGHGSLREAERCARLVLERLAAPPKTERTG